MNQVDFHVEIGQMEDQCVGLLVDLAALLSERPGLRKEDVFISIVEVKKENWSFGNGIAQYVER